MQSINLASIKPQNLSSDLNVAVYLIEALLTGDNTHTMATQGIKLISLRAELYG